MSVSQTGCYPEPVSRVEGPLDFSNRANQNSKHQQRMPVYHSILNSPHHFAKGKPRDSDLHFPLVTNLITDLSERTLAVKPHVATAASAVSRRRSQRKCRGGRLRPSRGESPRATADSEENPTASLCRGQRKKPGSKAGLHQTQVATALPVRIKLQPLRLPRLRLPWGVLPLLHRRDRGLPQNRISPEQLCALHGSVRRDIHLQPHHSADIQPFQRWRIPRLHPRNHFSLAGSILTLRKQWHTHNTSEEAYQQARSRHPPSTPIREQLSEKAHLDNPMLRLYTSCVLRSLTNIHEPSGAWPTQYPHGPRYRSMWRRAYTRSA